MRRGALVDLLIRPVTIIQVAVFAPLAVLLLFLAAALRPGAAVAASSVVCAGFGLFVGQAIRVAARCVFAWTLPAFRRALLLEFVAGGLAVSGLATAITLVGGAGLQQTVSVFAVGFASFTLGGVSLLAPEWTQLIVLAWLFAFSRFASSRTAATAILGAPLYSVALAGAVSALVLWGTFSRGAFRWSALTGPRQAGRAIWHEWPMMARRPRARAGSTGADAEADSPARDVGNLVVGGVLATYRTVRPLAWLVVPFVFLLGLAAFQLDAFGGVLVRPSTVSWIVLIGVWWMGAAWSARPSLQMSLPWSRRHHTAVAYARDLGDAVLFLFLMLAAAAIVGGPSGLSGPVLRGLAVMAMFFPAIRWVFGPPVGERWRPEAIGAVLALFGMVAFLAVFNLVVAFLPALVSSDASQGIVLVVMVLLSQVLHWRSLHRYLATRDLVGGSI